MKVSIITVVYNNATYIGDAIESVINQDYPDKEYIIIDGGSTDGTVEIIKAYKNSISLFISEPDMGIYDAINKGIKHSTGDIISLLHSDDIYTYNGVLSDVVNKFESNNTDSVYTNLEYITKMNCNKVIRRWNSGAYKTLAYGWMPPHPAFFIKRKVFARHGLYNTNLKISADYDLVLRMIGKHKISVSYLPEVTVKMRVGGESNKSFTNIINKSREDYISLKTHKMPLPLVTLFFKNIRKISQLVNL